jgi:hypothetical protein
MTKHAKKLAFYGALAAAGAALGPYIKHLVHKDVAQPIAQGWVGVNPDDGDVYELDMTMPAEPALAGNDPALDELTDALEGLKLTGTGLNATAKRCRDHVTQNAKHVRDIIGDKLLNNPNFVRLIHHIERKLVKLGPSHPARKAAELAGGRIIKAAKPRKSKWGKLAGISAAALAAALILLGGPQLKASAAKVLQSAAATPTGQAMSRQLAAAANSQIGQDLATVGRTVAEQGAKVGKAVRANAAGALSKAARAVKPKTTMSTLMDGAREMVNM